MGLRQTRYKKGAAPVDEGKNFETLFDMYCRRYGIIPVKFPQGAKWIGSGKFAKMLPVATPCDRILMYPEGHTIFVDCKSFGEAKNLTRSMLTEHQVTSLKLFSDYGVVSGYIVFFRSIKKIVYFSADQLWDIFSGKGSCSPADGLDLGTWDDMRLDRLFQEYHGTCY